MRVANYHLAGGDMREALRRTSRVLGLAEDCDAIIFHYYRRFEVPVDAALETGLPAEERAWRAYFEELLRWAKVEQAERVWDAIVRNSYINDALAVKSLEYLISSRAYDKAVAVLAGQLGGRRGDYPERNLLYLYNGGFEQEFTEARLDWRVRTGAAPKLEAGALSFPQRATSRDRLRGIEQIAKQYNLSEATARVGVRASPVRDPGRPASPSEGSTPMDEPDGYRNRRAAAPNVAPHDFTGNLNR